MTLAPLAAAALALSALAASPAGAAPADALLARARQARDAGRLDEALATLDALLAAAPEHEALLDRGQVLAWQGRTGEALASYRAFRAHHPERALEADLRIAQAQAWADELPAALSSLAPWVERGERQAVLDDATYRSWAGDLPEVAARLGGWLASHPDDREARLRLARARSWQSRWEEARAEYGRVLARSPGDAEATLGLAQLDLWAARPAQARARLESLPAAARGEPEPRLLEARLAVAEGRPARARALLGPLLGGPTGREAERLLDELVAGQGLWTRLAFTSTDTSEGLRQRAPALTTRLPLGEGRADVEVGWSEVAIGGEATGATVASAVVTQPLGARASADAGLGFRERFAGVRGLTGRGGATVLLLPEVTLRADLSRQLLDFTPKAVGLHDGLTALEAGATWTSGEGTRTLAAGGSGAWLDAGTYRVGGSASLEQRASWRRFSFAAGAQARGFGYSKSRPDLGFFNPGRYLYAGVSGGLAWGRGTGLELEAGLRGGWQKVNRDAAQFAWSYDLSAAFGREGLQLLALWSHSFAGLPVTAATDPATYRERTLRVALRLAAPR